MSNENYNVEVKEEKCFCQSKFFRKFMVVALGTFVGAFLAMSLFAAMHKPPMPPCGCPCGCGMMMKHHHHHHFDRGMRGEIPNKMDKKVPVRVEIDD